MPIGFSDWTATQDHRRDRNFFLFGGSSTSRSCRLLFCGLGLLMALSVQQYTIGNSRRVLNG
jgi:hypothetical protein